MTIFNDNRAARVARILVDFFDVICITTRKRFSYFIVIGVRAIFCQRGRCTFAQIFSQVAQIFMKQSKGNEGHMMH